MDDHFLKICPLQCWEGAEADLKLAIEVVRRLRCRVEELEADRSELTCPACHCRYAVQRIADYGEMQACYCPMCGEASPQYMEMEDDDGG